MGTNGQSSWLDSEAGQELEQRLATEKTLKALDHILERIETIEKAVDGLSTVMSRGPGLVSMAADVVDESYSKAAARGVDIDQRLKTALEIAEKLTAPEMVEKLDGLFKFADQLPGMVSMGADIVDEGYRNAFASGIDIDKRLKTALDLAEKLTSPVMVEKLNSLFDFVNQAPGMVSMVADIADETYKNAVQKGIDIDKRLQAALEMSEKLTAPETVEKFYGMLELADRLPGMMAMIMDTFDAEIRKAVNEGLDLDALKSVLSGVTMAVSKASEMPPARVGGPWGLYRAMKDDDRQKSLSFLMDFAKAFGIYMKHRDIGFEPLK